MHLRGGFKLDQPWWYTTKMVIAMVVGAVAGYVVYATLL